MRDAADADLSLVYRFLAGDCRECGTFSGSVGPKKTEYFTGFHLHGEAAHHPAATPAEGHAVQRKDWISLNHDNSCKTLLPDAIRLYRRFSGQSGHSAARRREHRHPHPTNQVDLLTSQTLQVLGEVLCLARAAGGKWLPGFDNLPAAGDLVWQGY